MLIADLHIHSKYSRASSKEGVPEYLDLWAGKKGIDLLGTGDFTHPAWRQELKEKLIPAEDGLYTLRSDAVLESAGRTNRRPRFVVSGEISSIYKKNGKTRKVHNLILLPGLEAAEELSRKLEAIGNIHSDGRPILGLDSRDLLEITLETCPEAIFIPAHIWTPHFSLFGAFSGFDTIEECFEDLTPYIHALETGLSSDPPMNWRVSALDRFTLVSNSDAHSPAKLGREANLLDIGYSYAALSHAIQTGDGFAGTIEFFPEEGKYHYDGHRNCGICLSPEEARPYEGICPICGKKLTTGVQHRIDQLTDRAEGARKANAKPFESLVPLPEVIAGSTGSSANSKKTLQLYEELLRTLGSEFDILRTIPAEDIAKTAGPCVAEGIRRLRNGQVRRTPGFDGEYGKIELLSQTEIEELVGQTSLLLGYSPAKKKKALPKAVRPKAEEETKALPFSETLNEEQQAAVLSDVPVTAVIAGPGTGKTQTLISRIAALVDGKKAKPSEITAVTFTNLAAKQLKERLEKKLGGKASVKGMTVGTFHAICFSLLKKENPNLLLADEFQCLEYAAQTIKETDLKITPTRFLQEISKIKNGVSIEQSEIPEECADDYNGKLRAAGLFDFDDLLLGALRSEQFSSRPFTHLLVDEFQDINPIQYRLIQKWSQNGKSLFVIGDPDQSIYGFRGSDAACFERLKNDCPETAVIHLRKNYRSADTILSCALSIISKNPGEERVLEPQIKNGRPVRYVSAESPLSEGIFIAKEINRMVGGVDMLDAQSYLAEQNRVVRGFSDIAVLYRTHRQADILETCLKKEGIPYVVTGRDDFLTNRSVRGMIAFLRFLSDQKNTPALKESLALLFDCPPDLAEGVSQSRSAQPEEPFLFIKQEYGQVSVLRGWFDAVEKYLPLFQKEKPFRLLEKLAADCALTDQNAVQHLIQTAVFHKDCVSFLDNLLLGQEADFMRSGQKHYASGAVTLMTLHGAKGLEFSAVFLCGVNKGIIPLETKRQICLPEEERRLFYVGLTRAKEELLLTVSTEASDWIKDIPTANLLFETAAKPKPRPDGVQLRLF